MKLYGTMTEVNKQLNNIKNYYGKNATIKSINQKTTRKPRKKADCTCYPTASICVDCGHTAADCDFMADNTVRFKGLEGYYKTIRNMGNEITSFVVTKCPYQIIPRSRVNIKSVKFFDEETKEQHKKLMEELGL